MVEIIRRNDPLIAEELKRDFRPFEIWEGNAAVTVVGEDHRLRVVHRRRRVIRYISTLDGEKARDIITDLGPATAQEAFVLPCDGEVELCHALELIEWAKRSSAERAARNKAIKPERDRAFLEGLADTADDWTKRKLGRSTYGPGGKIQREGA